ncbi:recombination regulator RecX [Vibrio fluvialis]|uniref:recombination regulator RecX n=1 Tax=Vibrio fluvialis TaxID=676 RepID=UPI001C9CBD18|nr:recombination regulator RecX [Vibrio fluvialis]
MYSRSSKMTCKENALFLLTRRDHGEYELHQKLLIKGFEPEEVEQAVSYCQEHGYLNDLRYAHSQVRQHVAKGHGERRIRQELQQKRVDSDTVSQAIEEEGTDWFELAKVTAQKKFSPLSAREPKEYAKRVRFLQYRGFSFDQIQHALSDEES